MGRQGEAILSVLLRNATNFCKESTSYIFQEIILVYCFVIGMKHNCVKYKNSHPAIKPHLRLFSIRETGKGY